MYKHKKYVKIILGDVMKIKDTNYDIKDLVEEINIDSNIPKKRKNGLVLRDTHIEILKKYNIEYEKHASLSSLIFEIEEILNYETDCEDLEWLSYELSEINYYNYTNK